MWGRGRLPSGEEDEVLFARFVRFAPSELLPAFFRLRAATVTVTTHGPDVAAD